MDNLENISWKIWQSEGFGGRLLIGGLLFYVPLFHFLLLGYFGLVARSLVRGEGLRLPEWRSGSDIFEESVRLFLPALLWLFAPILVGILFAWFMASAFSLVGLVFFARTLALLPLSAALLAGPLLYGVAMFRYYRSDNIQQAFAYRNVVQTALRLARRALFPLAAFYGACFLGFPLLGFVVFAGALPLIAQLRLLLNAPRA